MPSPYRRALLGITAVSVLLLAAPAPALAAETTNSEFVIIRPGDTVDDDLYAGAIKVSVEGTIEGDLIAFAGEEIVIDGSVTGSVFALAPRVVVNGSVGGSVRVATGSLTVGGQVGGDIVVAGYEVSLTPNSNVGGDVIAWSWQTGALGSIGRDLEGTQGTLELAGEVGGDVDVSVRRLVVVDALVVDGDLGYRSDAEAEGLELADVGGTVVRKTPLPPNLRVRGLMLFGRFLIVVFLTICALAVAYGWPERSRRAISAVRRSPFKAWGLGALIMLSPLLLVGVAALVLTLAPSAASLPLMAVLGPVILAALGLVLALSLVAGIPAVGRLGELLFRKLELHGAVLAGATVAAVMWFLPWVGWLVPLIVLPLGQGGWLMGRGEGAPAGPEAPS